MNRRNLLTWVPTLVLFIGFCVAQFTIALQDLELSNQKIINNNLHRQIASLTPSPDLVLEDPEISTPTFVEREFVVTAYCPCEQCCGKYSDGVTSTGGSAFTKGVAVDPKLVSYGTLVEIPGYGKVKADDCGGAIKGNRLDVRFSHHTTALKWGVQKLKVKIYD